jgi:hypothetical protein
MLVCEASKIGEVVEYSGQHITAAVSSPNVVANPKALVFSVQADVHPLGHIPGARFKYQHSISIPDSKEN